MPLLLLQKLLLSEIANLCQYVREVLLAEARKETYPIRAHNFYASLNSRWLFCNIQYSHWAHWKDDNTAFSLMNA